MLLTGQTHNPLSYASVICRYNAFMLLPQGLVRGLATKKLDLDDDDNEDEVVELARGEIGTGQAGEGTASSAETRKASASETASMGSAYTPGAAGNATSYVKYSSMAMPETAVGESGQTSIWSVMQVVASMFRKSEVPVNGKRTLKPSAQGVLWMTAPFIVWGVIIVALNGIADLQVKNVRGKSMVACCDIFISFERENTATT